MQIPILSGIYTDGARDFRVAYPKNMMPVPVATGMSAGYLKPAEGVVSYGNGPGTDRGGINWNGSLYRVMGSQLCRIAADGTVTQLGNVGLASYVTLDYSFDALAIASAGSLYYYDGTTLTRVTDTDLGNVLDMIWVDGYFMTTDGTYLIVTELNDPTSVNPLKYGSAEADPDPIVAIVKLRNEPVALNRYTIETFENVGGDSFPFARVEGAQIMKGCVGTHMACIFLDAVAFVGGGRNESISVFIGSNGQAAKIATREIDQILSGYTESVLSGCKIESRVFDGHSLLYIHLPDQTLCYDAAASQAMGTPVWFILETGGRYQAQNFVYCYDKWLCGNPTSYAHGYLTDTLATMYGTKTSWEISAGIIYNEGRGAIFHEIELVALTGELSGDPVVWTSYSEDGETWSMERSANAGGLGYRVNRIRWMRQGRMRNWRIQKFRGTSDAKISISRLNIRVEPLNV